MLSEFHVELDSNPNLQPDVQSVLPHTCTLSTHHSTGAFAWVLTMESSFNPNPVSYPFHMFLFIRRPFSGFGLFYHFCFVLCIATQNYNLQLFTSNLENYFVCVSTPFSAVNLPQNNESFLLQSSVHPLLKTCQEPRKFSVQHSFGEEINESSTWIPDFPPDVLKVHLELVSISVSEELLPSINALL